MHTDGVVYNNYMYNTFDSNVLYNTHNIQLVLCVCVYIGVCVHTCILNFENPASCRSSGFRCNYSISLTRRELCIESSTYNNLMAGSHLSE